MEKEDGATPDYAPYWTHKAELEQQALKRKNNHPSGAQEQSLIGKLYTQYGGLEPADDSHLLREQIIRRGLRKVKK